jgi:hypothetical protein
VVPVPGVVRKMCFFSDGRIRRALALLDLAHRDFLAVRDLPTRESSPRATFRSQSTFLRPAPFEQIGPSGPNPDKHRTALANAHRKRGFSR